MWSKTYTSFHHGITPEQLWKLYANVSKWHLWDDDIEFACIDGEFTSGKALYIKPKNGARVKIDLLKVEENKFYRDLTHLPFSKMYGEHWFERTAEGTKITVKITTTGMLSSLWMRVAGKTIFKNLPGHINKQIELIRKSEKNLSVA